MKRRQVYIVSYSVNYDSGSVWKTSQEVYALSESGAAAVVKWLKSDYRNLLKITDVSATGRFVGMPIYEDLRTLGDW
jgi:hypothetical protein